MKLIVNLPAYNEEKKIADTISRIPRSFPGVKKVLVQVIDDGSRDNTVKEAKDARADIIISHKSNRGLGVMFQTMRESALAEGADILVNIDADGQFDPKDIAKLIEPVVSGEADITIADRFSDESYAKNIPFLKDKLNRLGAWLVSQALNTNVSDLTNGFRAHNREALLRLNNPAGFTYTQETIIDAIGKNMKLMWVPVHMKYFKSRKSRVVKSVWRYVNGSARIMVRAFRDIRPLKFFGLPGAFLLLLSLGFFAVFIILYLPDQEITKNRNYFFGGVTFAIVGLQFFIFALIADMVKGARKLSEETLYQMRKSKYDSSQNT